MDKQESSKTDGNQVGPGPAPADSIYGDFWSDRHEVKVEKMHSPGSVAKDEFEFGDPDSLGAAGVPNARTNSLGDANPNSVQLSLGEMFFIVTLAAVAFWLYQVVHPFLALLVGAAVLFFAAMKAVGPRSLVLGGLIGCVIAFFLVGAVGVLSSATMGTMIALLMLGPPCGYLFGGLITELADDENL